LMQPTPAAASATTTGAPAPYASVPGASGSSVVAPYGTGMYTAPSKPTQSVIAFTGAGAQVGASFAAVVVGVVAALL